MKETSPSIRQPWSKRATCSNVRRRRPHKRKLGVSVAETPTTHHLFHLACLSKQNSDTVCSTSPTTTCFFTYRLPQADLYSVPATALSNTSNASSSVFDIDSAILISRELPLSGNLKIYSTPALITNPAERN